MWRICRPATMAKKKPHRREAPKDELLSPTKPANDIIPMAPKAPPENGPTIVGVGASAGGLDAFSQLLHGLPERPGIAIVFVQHLSPQYSSVLATLFSGSTKLPVKQLADETTNVEPDNVYVIPRNRHLILQHGKLQLLPRPVDVSQYNPVDVFFRSLAEQQTPAIGVILSGTASDGVDGVHAIKAEGGTIIVQDPETARFEGMPGAGIGTGKVDMVLPAEDIGPALVNLARNMPVRAAVPRHPGDDLQLSNKQLDQMFALLRGFSGVDFGHYKLPTIQ